MEGSSQQVDVKGGRVAFAGPFKPGRTSARIAFQLPPAGEARAIDQVLPVAVDALSVIVQKVGALQVRSAQLTTQREAQSEGKVYVMTTGPALPAGRTLSIALTGLPHHETWPRTIGYVLAAAILAVGAWMAVSAGAGGRVATEPRRRALESTRERLFGELVRLEDASRSGRVEAGAYADQRAALVAELERVYAELDSLTHVGGERGAAA